MTIYPEWLKKKTPKAQNHKQIRNLLNDDSVYTVCESALCPNRGECFSKNTVTFMILGKNCSRSCSFCAVAKAKLQPLDPEEPQKIANLSKKLKLGHVVITSVTRDDLSDGGAQQFADTIQAVRRELPLSTIEVLTPDFQGNNYALDLVLQAQPDVFNHNVETVQRLYPEVRPQANIQRSLNVLKYVRANYSGIIKSGLMLGLGETETEVKELLNSLKISGVNIVTIGQYLAPSKNHYPVREFIAPEKFGEYKEYGEKVLGIKSVFAGPFVRSSYLAGETLAELKASAVK